ncbi:CCAAT/enhancer-binding protein zeta [Xenentodon cancila]
MRLGGTKADYILLAGLDDCNELVDGGKKGAIDDLEEGELESFITKLGIRTYAGQQTIGEQQEEPDGTVDRDGRKASAHNAPTQGLKSDALLKAVKPTRKTEDRQLSSAKKTKQNVFEFQPRQVLLIKPGGKWFELEYAFEGSLTPQDPNLVAQYLTLAQQLFEAEVALYKTKKNLQKGANTAWMKTVVSSGVLADRMAAMTVLLQDAPVHMLEHVENLINMVKKKGSRRMGLMAMDTLRELLLSNLLPEDRKLRPFSQHPFDELEWRASGNRDTRDRHLILWFFEHRLKHHVAEFVAALDLMAHDTVTATKAKALATAHELLCSRPEQERALLIQVVNKLGDPDYKTASKASHLLETLLHRHPNMKEVVCGEVERLLFRPNICTKAQYYAVCFLSQVALSHAEAQLASKLITIYFSFFQAVVKEKDVQSKMLSALLTGVNRAYPYASTGDNKVKEQLDTLFKVVHLVKFNTAVHALMLLFQVMDSQQSVSDRYYTAVYRKLLDPGLSSCATQSLFLNLLYKSLKADVALRRVKAFVKRLLSVSAEQSASFACGALFLVSEIMKAKPGLKTLLQEVGDEEEEFRDLAEDEEDAEEGPKEPERWQDRPKEEMEDIKPTASWIHHQNLEGRKTLQSYDPLHRNPLFSGADHASLWELQKLALHYHPSVSLFAKMLLQGDAIQYSGDPLQDFTLIRFLDRFVFRNPKQLKGKRNNYGPNPKPTVFIQAHKNTDFAALRPRHRLPVSSLPVNSTEFLSKDETQIPVDEVFFHRFFRKRQQERRCRRPTGDGDNESVEDVDDDEFEKLLDSFEGDSYYTDVPGDELDFAGNVKSKKQKKGLDTDSDESNADDLDDEEVSLGSMDEEDFGDELEEEGGTFMDLDGGRDDDDDDDDEAEQSFEGSALSLVVDQPVAVIAPLRSFSSRLYGRSHRRHRASTVVLIAPLRSLSSPSSSRLCGRSHRRRHSRLCGLSHRTSIVILIAVIAPLRSFSSPSSRLYGRSHRRHRASTVVLIAVIAPLRSFSSPSSRLYGRSHRRHRASTVVLIAVIAPLRSFSSRLYGRCHRASTVVLIAVIVPLRSFSSPSSRLYGRCHRPRHLASTVVVIALVIASLRPFSSPSSFAPLRPFSSHLYCHSHRRHRASTVVLIAVIAPLRSFSSPSSRLYGRSHRASTVVLIALVIASLRPFSSPSSRLYGSSHRRHRASTVILIAVIAPLRSFSSPSSRLYGRSHRASTVVLIALVIASLRPFSSHLYDDEDEEVPDDSPLTQKKRKRSSEELDFGRSLEEFGSLLDDNAGSQFDNIGLNAVANTDRAGLKQLKWEAQRDDWIQGRDAKTLRRKKMAFSRARRGSRMFRNRK